MTTHCRIDPRSSSGKHVDGVARKVTGAGVELHLRNLGLAQTAKVGRSRVEEGLLLGGGRHVLTLAFVAVWSLRLSISRAIGESGAETVKDKRLVDVGVHA